DLQTISASTFDTDKDWIFVAAKDFGAKCGAQIQATQQMFRDTQVVREVRYVGGIFVPVFPTYIVAPVVVDLNIGWFPWGPGFIGGIFNVWNFVWNNIEINVVVNVCHPNNIQPMQKPITPITSNPPPPPGGSKPPIPIDIPKLPPRVDNPPPQLPPRADIPPVRVFTPPPVIDKVPPRVVTVDPPPVFVPPVVRPPLSKPPVIDRCFGGRCQPPILGRIGSGDNTPKPSRTPTVFGGGRGPVFTNIGRQAGVGASPSPMFTGRSVATPAFARAGGNSVGAGFGMMHGGGAGFGRFH
ncbi:MAG: hypothetical protein JOZ16_13135, partial [Methylobacteriaceae bacterium]|nr:hypothetical protein [Methylobacteriaceae bacterium]